MEICTVTEYIYHGNGLPMVDIYGYAKILALPASTASGYYGNITGDGYKAYTDSSGVISWGLPQGASVSFTIEEVGLYNSIKTIPASATARLKDI